MVQIPFWPDVGRIVFSTGAKAGAGVKLARPQEAKAAKKTARVMDGALPKTALCGRQRISVMDLRGRWGFPARADHRMWTTRGFQLLPMPPTPLPPKERDLPPGRSRRQAPVVSAIRQRHRLHSRANARLLPRSPRRRPLLRSRSTVDRPEHGRCARWRGFVR